MICRGGSLPCRQQVFITTTGGSHGSDLEKELKFRGMHVIVKNTDRPKEVTKTAVFCYDPDPCQQTAHSVVDLLQEEGYAVAKPTPPENGFGVTAQDDDATKLFNKKLIDIVLADEKEERTNQTGRGFRAPPQPRPVQPKRLPVVDSGVNRRSDLDDKPWSEEPRLAGATRCQTIPAVSGEQRLRGRLEVAG